MIRPVELRVAVEPWGEAVEIVLRELHAVVTLVEVFQELRCPGAELPGDGPAAAVDAGVDRAVGNVEVEPVLPGQVRVGAGPAVAYASA